MTPTLHPVALAPTLATTALMLARVQAGFPSPAASYAAGALDFNQYLVSNAPATFALYAAGDSMSDAGIDDGDLLVVDRAREAVSGDIVIVQLATEFTVKRLRKTPAGLELHPENARVPYPVLRPGGDEEWRLIGVVTFIVKHACPRSR